MKHSFIDKYSHINSSIHDLDPRAKFIAFFLSILIMVSEPHGETSCFIFYFALIFLLVFFSRVPIKFYFKRILVVLPLLLAIALLLPLSLWAGGNANIKQGHIPAVFMALSLFLKTMGAFILLLLLVSTNKFHKLLKGLRMLKMPEVLGQITAVMYRYIFLLNDERIRTFRAKESRTPGKLRSNPIRVYGNLAALIFLRSWERAHVIYNSMLSRGFTGNFPDQKELKMTFKDMIFSVVVTAVFLSVRIFY